MDRIDHPCNKLNNNLIRGSSTGSLRLGGMSPKLIYLPKTDKIKNGIAITSTKSDIGGLYMQTRGFNSITHLLTKKDDLLKEIDDLEERFNDAYRELEDRTGLIANSVDLP